MMEDVVNLLLTINLPAKLSQSQRLAPQLEHFAVPPGRALPQFAQNFLIAGATSVGCEPIDWDPVEYDPLLYCPDFSSCESAPSTATLTMVA
jgi:hypothetical protein